MFFFAYLIKFLFLTNLKLKNLEEVFNNYYYFEINGNIVIPPDYQLKYN